MAWSGHHWGHNRELKQRQRQRQRECQKSNRFIVFKLAKQQHHAFLFISLPYMHDYNVKVPIFPFCRGRVHTTTTLFFLFWTLIQSFRIQLQKNLLTFDELNEMHVIWNKRDKVWGNANSLLKWRFRSRPCPCCLNRVRTESSLPRRRF